MAESFANDEAEYLTDERWWQLVEEQDKEVLGEGITNSSSAIPEGFIDIDETGAGPDNSDSDEQPESPTPLSPTRRLLYELTRKYVHPTFRVEYEIQAYAVVADDPELPIGSPWVLRLDDVATRTYAFLVDVGHDVFRSTTMTPLDGLLTELTHRTVEFLKGQSQEATVAGVLADFRRQYCAETRLDPQEIISFAATVLSEIARTIPALIEPGSGEALYNELREDEKEAMARRMANRDVTDHKALISDGRFWDYADGQSLRELFSRHPELFLDGRYWDDAFTSIDFGAKRVTEEAKFRVATLYDAYLGDAVWLSNQTPADLERASRDTIIRATCSLRLLRPDAAD
jgi:hypothetical protein